MIVVLIPNGYKKTNRALPTKPKCNLFGKGYTKGERWLVLNTKESPQEMNTPRWGNRQRATDCVYFSELSPRPHDTGMVTLAGTQNLSEFELHARAILGLPIPEIKLERAGVSAVVLANKSAEQFTISGIEDVLKEMNTDVRIFRKTFNKALSPNGSCFGVWWCKCWYGWIAEKGKKSSW